jgi:hypothetical protein
MNIEPSAPYHQYENSIAERSVDIIYTMARVLLCHFNLPLELWPEACKTAAYILLRTPQSPTDGKTPYQLLQEYRGSTDASIPDLSHLKAFGYKVYVHIDKDQRQKGAKFAPRAREGILIGYDSDKIYRIWIPDPEGGKGLVIRSLLGSSTKARQLTSNSIWKRWILDTWATQNGFQ